MTKSSLPRSRAPNGLARYCLVALLAVTQLGAQGPDRTTVDADFFKEPGGTLLGQLMRGAAVTFGATVGDHREVTLDGWVAANTLRTDRRDGFDVSVSLTAGTPIRTSPASSASVRAMARLGALFDRIETRSSWVHVRRTAWIPISATVLPPESDDEGTGAASVEQTALPDSGTVSLRPGATLAAGPGGTPVGTLEATRQVELVERRGGWNRVLLEVWVDDAALSGDLAPSQVTAAAIRADPDRYVGQTVEWTLQFLAVRTADELRPELPTGQPYVLARGPLPETAFVYLVVRGEDLAAFREMEPLAQVRVRATVTSGRTRHLPTPVLELVRRLE